MPSMERESNRIVITGASSLLGAELKLLLEESKFAGWDFRLLDEEGAAGTLTEAGGEPAVDQFLDMGRSGTNVLGNALASTLVAKWEGALEPARPSAPQPKG